MRLKPDPTRSRAYLKFVDSLPSVQSGQRGCTHHHIIACGLGGVMAGKVSDLFTFPLTPDEHQALHADVDKWEQEFGLQCLHVLRTLVQTEAANILQVRSQRDWLVKL